MRPLHPAYSAIGFRPGSDQPVSLIRRLLDALPCRFALVHPVTDHTKLAVDEEGLAMLERLPGPIAPVFVIGPYRSGKSFLLNQLLGVRCGERVTRNTLSRS